MTSVKKSAVKGIPPDAQITTTNNNLDREEANPDQIHSKWTTNFGTSTMMNCYLFVISLLFLVAADVTGFVSPKSRSSDSSLSLAVMDAPTPQASSAIISPISFDQQQAITTTSSSAYLNDGVGRFITQGDDSTSAIMTSTNVLSLKDRPPPPTPEEIAAKKATFNLWFWGGGFVAPFLATFYYFGLKFWER